MGDFFSEQGLQKQNPGPIFDLSPENGPFTFLPTIRPVPLNYNTFIAEFLRAPSFESPLCYQFGFAQLFTF
jgi:hypothetical protein